MKPLLLACAALAACVDSGPGAQGKGNAVDRKYVAANLVAKVPADALPIHAAFGGRIEYAGSTLDHQPIAPGGAAKLVSYWRVLVPPGPGWRLFTQLRGAPGSADFMNLDPSDMELGHPLAAWQVGQIIRDEQTFTLRPDWKSKQVTVYVGAIRDGGHDDGARMPAVGSGATAQPGAPGAIADDAAIARVIDVDLSKAPPPPGTAYIPRAAGPITIDGVANDPGWAGALATQDFVPPEGAAEPPGRAVAKLTWDDQYLYVFVSVTDPDIVAPFKKHDDPLYQADCVEIFIDADNNRRGYIELQVNPNNATFDKWWPQTRAQAGDETWDSGMISAVKLRGTSEPGDTDQGWDAEVAIPWAAVKGRDDAMRVTLPPTVGDRWRMNIVRPDQKTGGTHQAEGGVSSWNRITNTDFHALERMMNVVFADHAGSIVPKPAPPAPPAPPVDAVPPAGVGSGSGSAVGSAAGSAALAPRVPVAPPAGSTGGSAHP